MDTSSLAGEIEALRASLRCARCRERSGVDLYPLPRYEPERAGVLSLSGILEGVVALCGPCRQRRAPRPGEGFVAWGRASGGLADAVLAVLGHTGVAMRRSEVCEVLYSWGRAERVERVGAALAALERAGRAVRVGRGSYRAAGEAGCGPRRPGG